MNRIRLRCLLVSLLTTVLEVTLFALCTLMWAKTTTLVVARWVCGSVGAGSNFTLNRYWTFRRRNGDMKGAAWLHQAGRYAVTALVAVSAATSLWWILVWATSYDPRIMHLVSMAVVWIFFTFPLMNRWVFKSARPA